MTNFDEATVDSRNFDVRVSTHFVDAIEILGFERRSIWGNDEMIGSCWAWFFCVPTSAWIH
jgi:hypothetical protein